MGHWGWRPLIVASVISVWIAGCNLIGDSRASLEPPPSYPAVTLTVGRAADRASPPPLDFAVTLAIITPIMPSAQATIATGNPTLLEFATSTPVPLIVEMPICSGRPGGGVACLGRIGNNLPFAVDRVVVDVGLIRGDGSRILESVAIEQGMIPSAVYAPYRALFDVDWNEIVGVAASLQSADIAPLNNALVSLSVEGLSVEFDGANAQVTGVILNTAADTVAPTRAVVTLIDAAGQVVAYRVISLEAEPLPPGGEADFGAALMLPPQDANTFLRASIYVEGQQTPGN